MPHYLFALGEAPALSLGELRAVIGDAVKYADPQFAILQQEQPIAAPQELLNRLGGTKRIIAVTQSLSPAPAQDEIATALFTILQKTLTKDKKALFGISVFGAAKNMQLHRLGITLKKRLKDDGFHVRFVNSNTPALSTASLANNHLLAKGTECVVVYSATAVTIGYTVAVQDIAAYANRDEQRPARSLTVGMMPLRVAQILLNLCRFPTDAQILDPFCGLGTILQEGLAMGYRMSGSDLEPQNVSRTERNVEWFVGTIKPAGAVGQITVADATSISESFADMHFDGMVSEGFLGQLLTRPAASPEAQKRFEALAETYLGFFAAAQAILAKNGRIVICFPFFVGERGAHHYAPWLDKIVALGYSQMDPLPHSESEFAHFNRNRRSLLYFRTGQYVGREITIWTK